MEWDECGQRKNDSTAEEINDDGKFNEAFKKDNLLQDVNVKKDTIHSIFRLFQALFMSSHH